MSHREVRHGLVTKDEIHWHVATYEIDSDGEVWTDYNESLISVEDPARVETPSHVDRKRTPAMWYVWAIEDKREAVEAEAERLHADIREVEKLMRKLVDNLLPSQALLLVHRQVEGGKALPALHNQLQQTILDMGLLDHLTSLFEQEPTSWSELEPYWQRMDEIFGRYSK